MKTVSLCLFPYARSSMSWRVPASWRRFVLAMGEWVRRHRESRYCLRLCQPSVRGLGLSVIGIAVFVCIAFASRVHSEGIQGRSNELSTARTPLPKGRSAFDDVRVPADRRLGRFDVDLGLPAGGDRASVQTNYLMMNILSSAISTRSITASKRCGIILHSASYPLIQVYMWMLEASAARDQERRICLDVFRRLLGEIENDDAAIRKAIDNLKTRDAWAHGSSTSSPLRSLAAMREAIRQIYDEDSTVHALVSIRAAHYAAIAVDQFRQWMENVRRSGPIRWLTDDPQLDGEGGIFERDINAWHEMPTPKRSMELIEINGFGPADIRAAVLVAVKLPADEKNANGVLEKYCRGKWNPKVDPADRTFPRCEFENVFFREMWVQFYYLTEDGTDETLRRLAADIARDPDVLALAAMNRDDGRAGHPYLVFFGY
jgi:hypothetical protein